jgi:serine phosphatase RsbU (regulator of sigma subunit)
MAMDRTEIGFAEERWVATAQARPQLGSGDCVRVVRRRDGRAIFFVGDVAGHDARAAALAAELDARLSEVAEWMAPGALLTSLNAAVEASWPPDVFISAVCFLLDPSTGRGTISVAGQLPPVVRGMSSCRTLDVHAGPALGLVAKQAYPERDFTLGAGDVLVAVTDGVTDLLATAADPLGLAALAHFLDGAPAGPLDICSSLVDVTRRFGGQDDATVLAVAPTLY